MRLVSALCVLDWIDAVDQDADGRLSREEFRKLLHFVGYFHERADMFAAVAGAGPGRSARLLRRPGAAASAA